MNLYMICSMIIAEFERLLGVTTSVAGMFQQNFAQVSQAILCIAAKLRGRKPLVDGLLKLLEKDPLDDMETESTEGNLSGVKTL